MTGTRVTCRDLTTGEEESKVIVNNYVVVCDGDRYVDSVRAFKNGTAVVTIKRVQQ